MKPQFHYAPAKCNWGFISFGRGPGCFCSRCPAAPVSYPEPMAASVASRIVMQAAAICAAMTGTGG